LAERVEDLSIMREKCLSLVEETVALGKSIACQFYFLFGLGGGVLGELAQFKVEVGFQLAELAKVE